MAEPLYDDIEKTSALKNFKSSENSSATRANNDGYDKESQMRRGSVTKHHDSFPSAFKLESFKRNPNARIVTEATDLEGRPLPDQPPAEPALAMKLKERHLQMIAIGGSIGTASRVCLSREGFAVHSRIREHADWFLQTGTGLFVGSGSALATGGPASLIIAYGLVGIMLYCTVHALGELAVAFPIAGAFSVYSSRFIDPAWGFAMGWNYALNWLVTLPLELTAASITVSYWPGAKSVSPAALVVIFWFVIVLINFFGDKDTYQQVRDTNRTEYSDSTIKRELRKHNIRNWRAKKRPILTEEHAAARLV
ncbi:uncharacterized protein RSE6_01853 [Rhynchosporium secalis]|uniref:Amino acid permease/ SLC12A domain-containing protein n=1 Tax=Rhynchosporium secalis TaxID=38038 RepID=A0A1E1M0G6_RHYSE|nr:uncharacterized protein RSE6_01853 [Rhynchosporium secalis]